MGPGKMRMNMAAAHHPFHDLRLNNIVCILGSAAQPFGRQIDRQQHLQWTHALVAPDGDHIFFLWYEIKYTQIFIYIWVFTHINTQVYLVPPYKYIWKSGSMDLDLRFIESVKKTPGCRADSPWWPYVSVVFVRTSRRRQVKLCRWDLIGAPW
jgi:hypothetical protein